MPYLYAWFCLGAHGEVRASDMWGQPTMLRAPRIRPGRFSVANRPFAWGMAR